MRIANEYMMLFSSALVTYKWEYQLDMKANNNNLRENKKYTNKKEK